jgi:hypothetical protein
MYGNKLQIHRIALVQYYPLSDIAAFPPFPLNCAHFSFPSRPKSTMSEQRKENVEDMSLLSISDGENARGIPIVKFIDNVEEFSNSFEPPASAELLVGAYSELHSKFKTFETSLTQKSE